MRYCDFLNIEPYQSALRVHLDFVEGRIIYMKPIIPHFIERCILRVSFEKCKVKIKQKQRSYQILLKFE